MTDYRHHPVGDPKWIWELNRLQHIPLLLAAWLVAEDEALAESAIADLLGWIESDTPGHGIAWANAFEPGLRAMSMSLALDALRTDGDRLTGCYGPVTRSLARHLAWIERFPSLHSSANNHRLGELCGVIVAGALVPELSVHAQAERALDELRRRCAEQFAPDGGHREQAFGYAVFATDMLLLAAASLVAVGRNVPGWLDHTLRRSARALELQLGDDDPEPRYGDCDDGRCADLDGHPRRTGRAVCDALATWFGDSRLADCAEPSATTVWLTGCAPSALTPRRSRRSGLLPQSGLVILRSARTTVLFDCGSHGFGPLYAHGHADALHVAISHAGVQVVGDPGTGSYYGAPSVRDAFRGTAFHATVAVDGLDQGVAAGPFLWTSVPHPKLHEVDLARRSATASHDGYQRLPQKVTHHRCVSLIDDGLVAICDTLVGSGVYQVTQRWPLHPALNMNASELTAQGTVDGVDVCIRVVAEGPATMSVLDAQREPLAGWWSDGLESVRAAPNISVEAEASDETWLATVISIGADGEGDIVERAGDRSIHVARRGRSHTIRIDAPASRGGVH